jgi:hypothetical protein
MKKRFTIFAMMLAFFATASMAQTVVLHDFEDGVLNPRFKVPSWTTGSISVVDNPLSDGINTSGKVLLITERGGSGVIDVELTRNLDQADVFETADYTHMSFKYYAVDGNGDPLSGNTIVARLGGDGSYDMIASGKDDAINNTWQTIVFDITYDYSWEFFQLRPFHENNSDPSYEYYFDDMTFYTDAPTSVNSPSIASGVTISPNPSDGPATLSLNLEQSTMVQARLFTASGQLIDTIKDEYMSAGGHKISFNVNSSGFFIMKLTLGNSEVRFLKLIVQ